MSQSKRHSAVETATNTAVGFVGSYFITFACFHVPGADLATRTLYATLGCTVWSLLRGYYLRRFFNRLHTRQVEEANADPLTGWKVDWENPFEADFVPCIESDDGYHYWPLYCGEHTKCIKCGVASGGRVGNVLAQPELNVACDCNQGRLPCTCKIRLCPHGEEVDIGCSECAEDYLQMRRDDQRNYENRG